MFPPAAVLAAGTSADGWPALPGADLRAGIDCIWQDGLEGCGPLQTDLLMPCINHTQICAPACR